MAEEKKTTTKKAPVAKKATAAKAAPKKETAVKKESKKAPKKVPTGKTLTVQQVKSPLGRTKDQYATLTGLGLGKINRTKVLEDTPSVRGMINKVKHLVRVIDEAA